MESPSGTFTIYQQITDYNCGPACVQSAIKYLSGNFQSQNSVATQCQTTTSGTYLAPMVSYLNTQQSVDYYGTFYQQSKEIMKTAFYDAVTFYRAPAILGFATIENDGWG